MLETLDYLMDIIHIGVILANCFFWMFPKLRRLHRVILGLTAFSWLALGSFYGLGYCFLTDWHWQIKGKLGEQHLPHSYISYLIEKLGFSDPGEPYVSVLTGAVFASIVIITLIQLKAESSKT